MDVDLRVGVNVESESSEHSPMQTDEMRNDEIAEIQSHLHGDDNDKDERIMLNNIEEDNLKSLINDDDAHNENDDEHSLGLNGDQNYDEETDEEDEEEDNIQITIGDFSKSSTSGVFNSYGLSNINLNLNKSGRPFGQNASLAGSTAPKTNKSSLDMDGVGTFNGQPIYDLNLDSLEDKPWRKPGADITDYFNYGFNEDSWKVYCDRQRKIRNMNATNQFDVNSVLNMNSIQLKMDPNRDLSMINKNLILDHNMPISTINENSKYNSSNTIVINTNKKPTTLPTLRKQGTIDVIGAMLPGSVPPPPPILTPMPNRPTLQPLSNVPIISNNSNPSTPTSTSEQNTKENFISVIGNRNSNQSNPSIAFLPPMSMPPPFGFPPPPRDFPPGVRPPMPMIPPPIGPNGQPLAFVPSGSDNFPMRPFPPGGGILPHPETRPFEEDSFHDGRRRLSPKFERDSHHSSREAYSSSGSNSTRSRNFRDYDERSSRHSYRDRSEREYSERSKERSRERSREKEYESSSRRHRSERKEKSEKDYREHRDKEHHREKESSKSKSTSSSSKHESSSSDHKHRHSSTSTSSSKSKSKRDKSRERESRNKDARKEDE